MTSEEHKGGPAEIRWYGVVLLTGHVALLILGVTSLWRVSNGGGLGVVGSLLFAAAYAALWRFLLAPGSRQRLPFRQRLGYTLAAGGVVLILGAFASLWLPTLIAISVVLLGDTLNERTHAENSPRGPATIPGKR